MGATGLASAKPIGAEGTTAGSVRASETRLAELAASSGPLRRVQAALAGRFVRIQGWERLGFARLGDFARERLGFSGRRLQELARVDRELSGLGGLESALIEGRLSWSKVRLLARFATAGDEEDFIHYASGVSVRQLEIALRAEDLGAPAGVAAETDEEGGSSDATREVALRIPLNVAFKWHSTCRYAAQVAGEESPPSAVLEWVTAESVGALADILEPEEVGDTASNDPGGQIQAVAEARGGPTRIGESPEVHCGPLASSPRRACALPRFLLPLVADLEAIDAFEVEARLQQVTRLEQRLDAEVACLLRSFTAASYASRHGHRTLAELARDVLGMSPRKARALLRIERAGEVCPALRSAYRGGTLTWVQCQILSRFVGSGDRDCGFLGAWLDWAAGVTVRRLDEVVGQALLIRDTSPDLWAILRGEPARIASVYLDGSDAGELFVASCDFAGSASGSGRQTCAPAARALGSIRLKVSVPQDVARLFERLLRTVQLGFERQTGRLATPGEAFEAMLDHARQTWEQEDPSLARRTRKQTAIFERDGWRCTIPGCTSRRNLHAHHIRFRSAGGGDEAENQTTLCAFHHLRGVHEGRVRVSGTAPHALWFELGVREGRTPLARFRSGDRVA